MPEPLAPAEEPKGNRNETADPGSSNDSNPCPASSDHPVILATGEKWKSETDFAAAGLYGLSLTRTYRSVNTYGRMFGPTWSANYELPRLQYTTSNCLYQPDTGWCLPREAFLTHPDGTRYRYEPQLATDPAEYRVRGAAATGSLYYTPTRWRLTLEKTTYTFSRTGILERLQTDTGTHQLTFSYSSADPTKLLRVTNRVGQSVSFTWTGERVTRVTDPGGNAWQYGYTADLRLASVTPPGAASPERVYHYEDAATPSC